MWKTYYVLFAVTWRLVVRYMKKGLFMRSPCNDLKDGCKGYEEEKSYYGNSLW